MTDGQINKAELTAKMADNLPVLRAKLGLTQEQLASIIGVSRHTVIHIERGKRQMTWSTFLSLVLVMTANEDTTALMVAMGIYTKELQAFLSRSSR